MGGRFQGVGARIPEGPSVSLEKETRSASSLPTMLASTAAILAFSTFTDVPLPVAIAFAALLWLGYVAVRVNGSPVHPAIIFGAITSANAVGGYFLYPLVREDGPLPTFYRFTDADWATTFVACSVPPIVAFSVAILVPSRRSNRPSVGGIGALEGSTTAMLAAFCVTVAAAYMLGVSPSSLMSRDTYQGFDGASLTLQRLGASLSLPAALMGAVAMVSPSSTGVVRIAGGLGFFVLAFISLGTASRELAIYPALLLISTMLVSGKRPKLLAVAAAGAGGLLIYSAVIAFRLGPDQGIIGYLTYLIASPAEVLIEQIPDLLAITFAGFPNAAYVIHYGVQIAPADFFASIDPRPASMIGYDTADAGFTVVSYIPYSTTGMLASLGTQFAVAYFAAIALTLSLLWRSASQLRVNSALPSLLLIGGSGLLALITNQYALRNSARLSEVFMLAAFALIFYFKFVADHPDGSRDPQRSLA